MKKISICVPVYNVENYIERCAKSILEQTYPEIEAIFVNDHTPDRSFDILKDLVSRYPKKNVKLIEQSRNMGPHEARRRALEASTGDYVFFADADDWLETNMMECLIARCNGNDYDIIGFNVIFEICNGQIISDYNQPSNLNEWLDAATTSDMTACIALWGYLIKRSVIEMSMYEQPFRLSRFEDFYLLLRAFAFSNKIYYLSESLYHHDRTNILSITKASSSLDYESRIFITNEIDKFLNEKGKANSNLESIARLKLQTKNSFIFNLSNWNPDKWRRLWPLCQHEVNMPFIDKAFYWLIEHKYDFIAKILVRCKSAIG